MKIAFKNVVKRKNRQGGVYHYYRVRHLGGREQLHRLPDDPTSAEFAAAYTALARGQSESKIDPMYSFDFLIKSYRASPRFKGLKPITQSGYDELLNEISAKIGGHDARVMRRQDVIAMHGAYRVTPRKANSLVAMVSIIIEHAIDLDWRRDNPSKGVKPYAQASEGYRAWTTDEQERYRRHTTGVGLLAFELALGTGQRRADLVRAAWADWDGAGLSVTQSKTGQALYVPGTARLVGVLAAERKRLPDILPAATPILHHSRGGAMRPYEARAMSRLIARAIKEAGLSGVTLHGLRTTAATELADAGCTTEEIRAITGHKDTQMVAHYIRAADQRKAAHRARAKLKE